MESQRKFLIENYGELVLQEEEFFEKDAAKILDMIKNNFAKYEQIDLFNKQNRVFLAEEEEFFKNNMRSKKWANPTKQKKEFNPIEIFDDKEDREYLRYQKELFGSSENSENEQETEKVDEANSQLIDSTLKKIIEQKNQIEKSGTNR